MAIHIGHQWAGWRGSSSPACFIVPAMLIVVGLRLCAYTTFGSVRHPARCAEPNCQTQINAGELGFFYPGEKSVYGSRCGHGEKAERDFAAHRIDEDSY